MNAGMYGMADGRGMAGRKFIGRVGIQPSNTGALVEGSFSASGLLPNALTTVAGVRTKLLGVSGRGALRWLGIHAGTGSGSTYRVEVVVDGVTVINVPYITASSRGPMVWGEMTHVYMNSGTNQPTPVFDYLPFESSIEVYLTASVSEATGGYYYAIDLHQ